MIAVPEFYSDRLGETVGSHLDLLRARLPRPLPALARRSGLLRGLALGWFARRGAAVAVIRRQRGSLPALLVCALPPARRRIVVLELIRRPLPPATWRRALYRIWWRLIENPALRRGCVAAQVMTNWERDEYASHYDLGLDRLHYVPWPWREGGDRDPAPISRSGGTVFASGRTACDWETVFRAAEGRDWKLSVICSRKDATRVRRLAQATRAEVRVETPWDVHDACLRTAAVCVISILDRSLSAGHVRLMGAVEAGIPVVATEVPSLDGYTVPGETALMVAPGDPAELARQVDALLADPARRRALRDAARSRADAWTYREYFAAVGRLIRDSAGAGRGRNG